jgi:arylsulfatase
LLDEYRYFNGLGEDMTVVADRLDDIGTRRSHSNYPWGWAQVGNTPAKRYKQNTHGGGVRDPLIVTWPAGLDDSVNGEVRHQFHHITDVVPTILQACGYDSPISVKGVEQQPVDGTSMLYAFEPGAADLEQIPTRKTSQYFEMLGHRGIWSNGWKAVTFHQQGTSWDDDQWELYHLDVDYSECHDLAASEPAKLAELIDLFWSEAERNGVLPIDAGEMRGMFAGHPTPGTPRARDRFVYYPPLHRIDIDAGPSWGARSWQVRAEIDRDEDDNGVLLAVGTVNNGLVIYINDGHLVYEHNNFTNHTILRSPGPVPAGSIVVGVDQQRVKRGPAATKLWIGDDLAAEGVIPEVSVMVSSMGMSIGRNPSGISEAYSAPFEFGGRIKRVVVDTERSLSPDDEMAAEIRTALGAQ